MTPRTMAAAVAITLTLAAITTELALPSIAENRMRDQLASIGSVTTLRVSTSPALKMLLGDVEHAAVEMSSATLDPSVMDADLLSEAGDVEVLKARIDTLRAGPFDAESVTLDKRGQALDASATLDVDQVESLMPGAELKVEKGMLLLDLSKMRLPLPLPGPVQLEIALEEGKVVARPLGAASTLLPTQPLLDRPELSVTRLDSRIAGDQLALTASATLNEL
ncbi:MAG TPA: hypothetical protein VFR87_11040 [Nocardioidaceae bacterium]|nr:hypothetical protein [Nocardioidaceae bacterium]